MINNKYSNNYALESGAILIARSKNITISNSTSSENNSIEGSNLQIKKST